MFTQRVVSTRVTTPPDTRVDTPLTTPPHTQVVDLCVQHPLVQRVVEPCGYRGCCERGRHPSHNTPCVRVLYRGCYNTVCDTGRHPSYNTPSSRGRRPCVYRGCCTDGSTTLLQHPLTHRSTLWSYNSPSHTWLTPLCTTPPCERGSTTCLTTPPHTQVVDLCHRGCCTDRGRRPVVTGGVDTVCRHPCYKRGVDLWLRGR